MVRREHDDSKEDSKVYSSCKALFRACIGFWQQLEAGVHGRNAEHQKRASAAQKGDGFMLKQFVTAQEVAEIMGVSVGKAYGIIRELNGQLKNQGFITVPGKVNRRFFEEKCLYGSAAVGE